MNKRLSSFISIILCSSTLYSMNNYKKLRHQFIVEKKGFNIPNQYPRNLIGKFSIVGGKNLIQALYIKDFKDETITTILSWNFEQNMLSFIAQKDSKLKPFTSNATDPNDFEIECLKACINYYLENTKYLKK